MNLWLLAFAALAAVPKVLGQGASSASSSALQAVAELPACAVRASVDISIHGFIY